MQQMFSRSDIISLDLVGWDTSNVTNMSHMFIDSTAQSIDISGFDVSKVMKFDMMFRNCYDLTSIVMFSGQLGSSVGVDCEEMFFQCGNLTSLDLSGWDTTNVTNMKRMFESTPDLETVNTSGWNTSNVTDMSYMFAFAGKNKELHLDLSHWNTSNVTTMASMFSANIPGGYPSGVLSLDLSNWDTSKVINMGGMFMDCDKLTSIPGHENFDTSSATNMGWMFRNTILLTNDDVNFDSWCVSGISSTPTDFRTAAGFTEEPNWGASC